MADADLDFGIEPAEATGEDIDFGIGHNGGPGLDFTGEEIGNADVMTAAAQSRMKSFVERIERLEEDKAGVMGDLKEVYSELKGEGFDTKVMRKVIARRKIDRAKREEEETLIALYEAALEMIK